MSQTKTILLTAGITTVVISMFWAAAFVLFVMFSGGISSVLEKNANPQFALSVEAPESIPRGQKGTLIIEVSNAGEKTLTLNSIDIYDSLLDGFEIVSVSPKPSSRSSLFGFEIFYTYKRLEPKESVRYELELRAKEVGTWSGDIDACNPFENFVTHVTQIEVIPEK